MLAADVAVGLSAVTARARAAAAASTVSAAAASGSAARYVTAPFPCKLALSVRQFALDRVDAITRAETHMFAAEETTDLTRYLAGNDHNRSTDAAATTAAIVAMATHLLIWPVISRTG